eukprot:8155165-Pyramimonas_sp.AAC.1
MSGQPKAKPKVQKEEQATAKRNVDAANGSASMAEVASEDEGETVATSGGSAKSKQSARACQVAQTPRAC